MAVVTTEWALRRAELARDLITRLYQDGLFRTWLRDRPQGWELLSGTWSPFYITLRVLPSRPALFRKVTGGLGELVKHELPEANRLLGLAATGIPLAAAVGFAEGIPMGFNRKVPNVRSLADLEREVSQYGGHSLIEGEFEPGDRVVLIDDVVTHFDSKEVAIRQLRYEMERRGVEGVDVAGVVTLVDRGRDTKQRAAAAGVSLHSLITLRENGLEMLRGVASDIEIDVVRDYIDNHERYQDPEVQQELRERALAR